MEQVALGSSLNELYFGILTVQNGPAELPVALISMGEAKFSTSQFWYSDCGMQECIPEQ